MNKITCFFVAFTLVIQQTSVLAEDSITISPDGTLKMKHNHRSGCESGNISGSYNTKFGVSGILYEIDCGRKGDGASFFFLDTQGSERCYGKMFEAWGGRGGDQTEWHILGSVPGYKCNSIGKTFQQNGMRSINK